jgi:hypothetical protein
MSIIWLIILGKFLTVMQQPFVPFEMGQVMQWSEAIPYGSIALLAHDYLSGGQFKELEIEDYIELIYSNGDRQSYTVTEIVIFDKGASNTEMFSRVYVGDKLVLQTCHEDGRLFVIANRVAE